MTQDYSTEAAAVVNAMNAVYENKTANKKNDISGDFSSDNSSYPTVKAVKSLYGSKVTSWSSTVSDTNLPSEKLVKDSLDGKAATSHNQATSTITNSAAYDNILSGESTTVTLTDQAKINAAINTKLGALANIELVVVTNDKGTASASTMNKLYLVAESSAATNDAYEIFITVRTGTSPNYTYTWEKVDTARIDLSGKADATHTHGDITNDGKIGSTANYFVYTSTGGKLAVKQKIGNITTAGKIGSTSGLPLITTTGGEITTGSFGSSSGQFAEGNHTHSGYTSASDVESEIGAFATALAAAINPSS